MDQSYSESDISLSPSQILERLQVLRQLQLLQRGKLQKQRLEYQETSENSSGLTEIVSHFSTSTSYNTFRSLLESANDSSNEATPRSIATSVTSKVKEKDLVEGVSILNLSQESEFIVNSPKSARSAVSNKNDGQNSHNSSGIKSTNKKHISLDDMPVLTPKKDFEALILEKLNNEVSRKVTELPKNPMPAGTIKKPFLKKGEGTSRFGVQKKDLVIQNTKSLPWRKNARKGANLSKQVKNFDNSDRKKVDIEILVTDHDKTQSSKEVQNSKHNNNNETSKAVVNSKISLQSKDSDCEHSPITQPQNIQFTKPTGKHPLLSTKGKTWATILTNDQNDFLRQLKQSDYYKNYASPAKSTISDASCDENLLKLRSEREMAEQNMFDLLESKVSHESFNLENSFFNRFLRRSQLECSGESTPLVLQQCLAKNPDLRTLLPYMRHKKRNEDSHTEVETNAECSDCCSETYSSVSSCCSCKTVEQNDNTYYEQEENSHKNKRKQNLQKKDTVQNPPKVKSTKEDSKKKVSDNVKEDSEMKANMVEMNAKLIATSELLKERLKELEDEIETFRKENANLTKMREDIDAERQKFYEEKTMFEQKFNEEKILSEYYIAEEKEKLTKQKQLYEKYVREMRGRLNRKDKDEVINLKKEISDLKEEIRLKDAKSTSTIARLRNQIKLFEKDKKDLLDEIEKLKKENRRIQHSNDMTRRMTNIKYLEEINKKLTNMTTKETQSEINFDSNAKYKAFEIERQSRPRKVQSTNNKPLRVRAKSVPNLKVTSRYAKYFSQRDAVSDMDKENIVNVESIGRSTTSPDNDQSEDELLHIGDGSEHSSDSEPEDNHLEKLYVERFHSMSPKSLRSNLSNSSGKLNSKNVQGTTIHNSHDDFFISKSTSKNNCISSNDVSPVSTSSELNSHRSRQSASMSSQRLSDRRSPLNSSQEMNVNKTNFDHLSNSSVSNKSHILSKSPVSILTNRSSSSHKPTTVIHKDHFRDTFNVTPEPVTSRSSASKTNLNPTEIRKPDGSKELRFPNGNIKFISSDGKYSKFVYYNGDVKENFYSEGRIKYFYAETKTCHTTHADGLEVLEFPDGQVEKRYKDGSSEIRLPNGSVRYFDPKNEHVREEWRFPDGTAITVSAAGEQRIVFSNGQVEVHAKDHKRREFPDGTVKLVYNDGTSETRYASGRVRIKDKHGNLIMDSATR